MSYGLNNATNFIRVFNGIVKRMCCSQLCNNFNSIVIYLRGNSPEADYEFGRRKKEKTIAAVVVVAIYFC